MVQKVVCNRSTLAKFREAVDALRAYEAELAARHEDDYRFPEREEVLLQDLERKTLAWLQLALNT